MPVHVFVDNSNVFLGAQRASATREAHIPRHAVRVYYKHLFRLIEDGRQVVTRVMAGSVPPGNEDLWAHAAAAGYNTDLLRKVASDDGRLLEQGVDELLHLKIANVLLDFDPPQTLVLATGDGKVADYNTSFPRQVERALRRNWQVEVWSWSEQMSNVFRRLSQSHAERVKIRPLDPFYPRITFVKAGTYEVDGQDVHVASRVVAAL